MNNKTISNLIGGAVAFYVLVFLVLGVGWIVNIAEIVKHINDPITGMLIVRIAGVFAAPLGGVLGYF